MLLYSFLRRSPDMPTGPLFRSHATLCLCAFVPLCLSATSFAQSTQPSVFVANNGNLEGSVTSFTLDDAGAPTFVDKLITGVDDEPGTNPQCIDITPDGRYLAAGHGTGADDVEQLTIIDVGPDASLSIAGVFQTTDSPLSLAWVDDRILAVAHTDLGATNEVLIYDYDRDLNTLTLIDSADSGQFLTTLAVNRQTRTVYANDSTANQVFTFHVDDDGALTPLGPTPTGGYYPLGIELSPTGAFLYGGGGISGGGDKIVGFLVNEDQSLSLIGGSPFISPGESPKGFSFSSDGSLLFVQHGTDATIRVMSIDQETGVLTNTGFGFDVGFQGTLGGTDVLGDWLLVTDESTIFDDVRGLYSFTYAESGRLTPNAPILDTQGITPESVVAWAPSACPADFNQDGALDILDFVALQNAFQAGGESADINDDGVLNILDFVAFQALFAAGCP
jgi:hypothetical protein